MKQKDEMDSCGGMNKEHGYLGEHRSHISKGHTPLGSAKAEYGTSKSLLKDDSAGNVHKNTNQKY